MRAWIFGASQASAEDALFCKRIRFGADDLIICADGGYNIAKFLGRTPHIVIGDMDSIRGKVPSDVKTIVYPRNKDKTDLHLCIDYALEVGCNEIILLCCFGEGLTTALPQSFPSYFGAGAEVCCLPEIARCFD